VVAHGDRALWGGFHSRGRRAASGQQDSPLVPVTFFFGRLPAQILFEKRKTAQVKNIKSRLIKPGSHRQRNDFLI
jgi:hypothetical protein